MSELKTHTEAEMRAIRADHERWIDSSEKEGGRADLSLTDLRPHAALLRTSCLSRANLTDADLSRANLSRAKGLLDPSEYLAEKFEATDEGILCYKSFGSNYAPPPDWDIEPHAVITEICNPCRTTACASGVNVATLEWAQRNNRCREIWKCLIRWIDLAGVVVPYNTDGKIRASRVELIEVVR